MWKKVALGITVLNMMVFARENLKFDIQNTSNIIKIFVKKDTTNTGDTDKVESCFIEYKVKPGDTLSKLAKKYNTTVKKLAHDNNIRNINLILVNQNLFIEKDSE